MNIHDLATATVFYGDDTRVTRYSDGTFVVNNPDTGGAWVVTRDDALFWGAWDRTGCQVDGDQDDPDEVIHGLIGDPR